MLHHAARLLVWICLGFIPLVTSCAPAAVTVAAALFIGDLIIHFPANSPASQLSDNAGPFRALFSDSTGKHMEDYEGILPGLTLAGATVAHVSLDTGTISGTVTRPEGDVLDLQAVLPGLQAIRRGDNAFALSYKDQDVTVHYSFTCRSNNDAPTVNVGVVRSTQPETWRLDTWANVEATSADPSARDIPLAPATAPIRVNAGPDQTMQSSESVKLEASAIGGSGSLHYAWQPAAGLDNPTILQPSASPSSTTEYTLLVSDQKGQQATDTVTVNVGQGPQVSALAASATGMPTSIEAGDLVLLKGSASGGAPPYSYRWSAAGWAGAVVQDVTVQPGATTTYTLIVVDQKGEQDTATVMITVAPPRSYIEEISSVAMNADSGTAIVYKQYLYVLSSDSLHVFSLSNPAQPVETGRAEGRGGDWCRLIVANARAYNSDLRGYFYAYDISNPSIPQFLGDEGYGFCDVSMQGEYLYALDPGIGAGSGLCIFSLRSTSQPQFVKRWSCGGTALSGSAGYLYVAEGHIGEGASLRVIDISLPEAPVQRGTVKYDSSGEEAAHVAASEHHAFVVDTVGRVFICDITNPAAPVHIATIDSIDCHGVTLSGSRAFLTEHCCYVRVFDLNALPAIKELTRCSITGGWPGTVAVNGSYVYVPTEQGLKVLRFTE